MRGFCFSMAPAIWSQASAYSAFHWGLASTSLRNSASWAAFFSRMPAALRPSYSPLETLRPFSMPKIMPAAWRACSMPWAAYVLGHVEHALHGFEAQGIGVLALELELGQGHQAVGRAGVAGNEDQLAVGGAVGAPLQVVGGLDRLAFFIGAENGHVQVVAREGEVVGVAAVEGGLLLGSEDQLDVGVLLVAIEPVLAALVEGDHVGAQPGLLQAQALDLGDDRLLGVIGLDRVHALLDRRPAPWR